MRKNCLTLFDSLLYTLIMKYKTIADKQAFDALKKKYPTCRFLPCDNATYRTYVASTVRSEWLTTNVCVRFDHLDNPVTLWVSCFGRKHSFIVVRVNEKYITGGFRDENC